MESAEAMQLETIAANISQHDRELIFGDPGRIIRRSKIEVIPDNIISNTLTAQESSPVIPDSKKSRTGITRVWPDVGVTVTATNPWTKEQSIVTVVNAPHRKSGKEFLYNNRRYHSPSPMCADIFQKRVSNGWNCIDWPGRR